MHEEVETTSSASAKRSPLLRSKLSWLGGGILAAIFAACVFTLPWTLGRVSDWDGPTAPPRYSAQDLNAILLPPSWAPHAPEEAARRDRYHEIWRDERERDDDPPFYLLGTDELGRDFFVRCLAGGGISLGIGLAAAAISVFIGTIYGMIAGFSGGRADSTMMRIVDVLYGLPYILLVVLLAVALDGVVDKLESTSIEVHRLHASAAESGGEIDLSGASMWLRLNYHFPGPVTNIARAADANESGINFVILLLAIGGVSWLTMARVIRGQVLSLKNQQFMEACRAIGVPVRRQFTQHLLPNLLGPIIVYATLTVPQAILQESFLSFLGIGVRPPLPSWGNLAADGLSQLNPIDSRWWLLLWPCALLGLTLLALNFVGESLREAFDPRRRIRAAN